MTTNKGGKGKYSPESLRYTGWRPPLIDGKYQDLVFAMMSRPEFQGQSTRAVIEAALREFATPGEIQETKLDE